MTSTMDSSTSGKVTALREGGIVFHPKGTNYELHLLGKYDGALNVPVKILIRATARKVWTVPSGGNFVTPIFGPPRIVQGRVRDVNGKTLLIHAGANFIVELPAAESAFAYAEGPIASNMMVNCTILPGATFELAPELAAR